MQEEFAAICQFLLILVFDMVEDIHTHTYIYIYLLFYEMIFNLVRRHKRVGSRS
jgi:hypothetical protein